MLANANLAWRVSPWKMIRQALHPFIVSVFSGFLERRRCRFPLGDRRLRQKTRQSRFFDRRQRKQRLFVLKKEDKNGVFM
jgi:hypothetical protein